MSETGASHSHFRSIRFKIVLAVGALAVSAVVAGVFGTRTVVQEILYRELDVHGNRLRWYGLVYGRYENDNVNHAYLLE